MKAQRLEELRALLADLQWEIENNARDMTGREQEEAHTAAIKINAAKYCIVSLRDTARQREGDAR
jgi:hypothetical protein